jgi:hypothetical protein
MNLFQQPRRKFLHTGIVGFCTALFAGLPKISFAKTDHNTDKGIVVHEDEGIHILTGRRKVPITIKISKAGFLPALALCKGAILRLLAFYNKGALQINLCYRVYSIFNTARGRNRYPVKWIFVCF